MFCGTVNKYCLILSTRSVDLATVSMLRLAEVRYVLPDTRELFANVSLQLLTGDSVAITGPSGIGKSTLLGVIGGLLVPTEGRVVGAPGRRACAWVLQSVNALGARSVLANAALLVTLDGQDQTEGRVKVVTMLEEVGLGGHMYKMAKTLSGGELQRLAVVRALASTRSLILADEPTTQLDRRNAATVMEMLFRTVTEEGRTLVVVTHDVESLPVGCRVLTLSQTGLIVARS